MKTKRNKPKRKSLPIGEEYCQIGCVIILNKNPVIRNKRGEILSKKKLKKLGFTENARKGIVKPFKHGINSLLGVHIFGTNYKTYFVETHSFKLTNRSIEGDKIAGIFDRFKAFRKELAEKRAMY